MAPIKRIGKYDVLETIGRGGMGIVFKATDPMLGRLVAVKMMTGGYADEPDLLRRFYREAQSTASLNHPNIVTVYDMGDQDGVPYLVMQFLEGESLQAIIKSRRTLSLHTKSDYILQVCHGLQYAHEQQITHRDVKPANIMVLPNGVVKIVDFGIARIGSERSTRPGQVMGSIHYMSPEQISEREIDARSDIFALGTVIYEFLTYTLPFKGQDMSSVLLTILHEPAPPLSTYLENYPPEFDAIVERALAKKKEDRYQSVDELAFDLAQVESRLRTEKVNELLCEAERLVSEGNLAHAREQLQHLMKLDPQSSIAGRRMREVQQDFRKRQRSDEVRQMRVQAEQFVAQEDFDSALRLLNQAIAIAPTEIELKTLRDRFGAEKARHLLIRTSMDEAKDARAAGDLVGALGSLDRLLAVDPHHKIASRMKDELALEVAKREKQLKIQLLIAEGRQHISEMKFSDALKSLKQVEELDADAPAVHELLRRAAEGAEQELRRSAMDRPDAALTSATAPVRDLSSRPAVLRVQQLHDNHDNSVLELTPPAGIVRPEAAGPEAAITDTISNSPDVDNRDLSTMTPPIAGTESGGAAALENKTSESASFGVSAWRSDVLHAVEKRLARFAGYLARTLVRKATTRTTDPDELHTILAANLECDDDRKARTKHQFKREALHDPATQRSSAPRSSASVELTSATIDHAACVLATYIGPIAGILAKRAARDAESPRTFHMRLAEYVDQSERSRFLRDVGE
jgi:serine/threonine protein kinase